MAAPLRATCLLGGAVRRAGHTFALGAAQARQTGAVDTPKLIATDMDGTLFTSRHEISPATYTALANARADGCHLMLASGRPTRGLAHIAHRHGLDTGPLGRARLSYSAFNGAVVTDAMTGEVVWERPIDGATAIAFLAHLRDFPVAPTIPLGEVVYVDRDDVVNIELETLSNGQRAERVDDMAALAEELLAGGHHLPKILVAAEASVLESCARDILAPFIGRLDGLNSAPFYLEVTATGVDKGSALEHYCARLGIAPSEAVAFGDNHNDLSMLAAAGLGVAMGNGVPAALEIADEVTGSNDEDGIAAVLGRWGW